MEKNIDIITKDSDPYILFYGNSFLNEKLPDGTRVIFPKEPIPGILNPKEAINYAIEHPLNQKPLSQILKEGMKITIAFDDISLPLPHTVKPDLRQTAIEVILEKLETAKISDIHLIGAIGLHRKMTKKELKSMLGSKIFNRFWPNNLYNFDAEDKANLKNIGLTEKNEQVIINKRVSESDLVIYVNINFTSMDGGHKSFVTGLCAYDSIKHHHNVTTLENSSLFDPSNSMLHDKIMRQGNLIEETINTFHIEMALNNELFPKPLRLLSKNPKNFTVLEKILSKLLSIGIYLPESLNRSIFRKIKSRYKLIGVYAGKVMEVHKKVLELNYKQYEVEVEGQSDIVIISLSDIGPYNVNSILNPVLFVCLIHGYYFNFYRNKPLLKNKGVLIIIYPLDNKFNKLHHPSYIDFYNNVLSKTLDHSKIEKEFEHKFANNDLYREKYMNSNSYHGVHPLYMWYWAVNGLKYASKTIIVKPKSKEVIERFGFLEAKNIADAVEKAKKFINNPNPTITYLKIPPLVTVKVK